MESALPKETTGGISAIAGFLYQMIGTAAFAVRRFSPLTPLTDEGNTAFEILLEPYDQDAGSTVQAEGELRVRLVQFKHSRNPEKYPIEPAELLLEITEKFRESEKRAAEATSGKIEIKFELWTNRELSKQADLMIKAARGDADHSSLDMTDEERKKAEEARKKIKAARTAKADDQPAIAGDENLATDADPAAAVEDPDVGNENQEDVVADDGALDSAKSSGGKTAPAVAGEVAAIIPKFKKSKGNHVERRRILKTLRYEHIARAQAVGELGNYARHLGIREPELGGALSKLVHRFFELAGVEAGAAIGRKEFDGYLAGYEEPQLLTLPKQSPAIREGLAKFALSEVPAAQLIPRLLGSV